MSAPMAIRGTSARSSTSTSGTVSRAGCAALRCARSHRDSDRATTARRARSKCCGLLRAGGPTRRSPTPHGSAPRQLLQSFLDDRVNELTHIAAEHRDLPHERRGDEGERLLRGQENGLDLAREMTVHVRELELEFKIGHGAQSANDDRGATLAREFDGELRVAR